MQFYALVNYLVWFFALVRDSCPQIYDYVIVCTAVYVHRDVLYYIFSAFHCRAYASIFSHGTNIYICTYIYFLKNKGYSYINKYMKCV